MFQGIQQQLMSMDRHGICLPFGSDLKSVEMVANQPQIKGGLVFAANPETEVEIQALGLPVLNLSNSRSSLLFPKVVNDDELAGVMVANHLLIREVESMCFLHMDQRYFTRKRIEGARTACEQRSISFWSEYLAGPRSQQKAAWLEQSFERVSNWLQKQSPPLSVILEDSRYADNLYRAAEKHNWRIPEDLKIVMIGNPLENLMLHTVHNITYLPLDWHSVAAHAIRSLIQWVEEGISPVAIQKIPPLDLVVKSSSGAGETGSLVARTLSLMENSRDYGLNASDVAHQLGVAPVTLYKHFKAHRGHSLKKELMKWRSENAKRLLRTTALSIGQISSRCGFSDVSNFTSTFKREVGVTPGSYRNQHPS